MIQQVAGPAGPPGYSSGSGSIPFCGQIPVGDVQRFDLNHEVVDTDSGTGLALRRIVDQFDGHVLVAGSWSMVRLPYAVSSTVPITA